MEVKWCGRADDVSGNGSRLADVEPTVGCAKRCGKEGAVGIVTNTFKRARTVAAFAGTRYDELKQMLEERRRELLAEVQTKVRGVRADGAEKRHELVDEGEASEFDI